MISKSLFVSAVVLALGLQVNAQAGFLPAVGVSIHAAFTIDDVQRPTPSNPCGGAHLNDSLRTSSTPVMIASTTSYITITGASLGPGGPSNSLQVSSWSVNANGVGWVDLDVSEIIQNGNPNPLLPDFSQFLVFKLPSGTVCSIDGQFCLLSLNTTSGYGNCVAVQVDLGQPTVTSQADAAQTDTRAVGTRAVRAYLEGQTE